MLAKFLAAKHALRVAAMLLFFTASASVLRADPMVFSGTTTGTFTQTGTNTLQTLTFNPGSFSGSTSNSGFVAFGDPSQSNGSFGSFTLGTGTSTYTSNPFTLKITFTNPGGISGGQQSTFTATVTGSVTSGQGGGAVVKFNPDTQVYTFSNGVQTGSFTLNLGQANLFAGQTTPLGGNIQATAVATTPEPMSLTLLGTGLLSVAGAAYRKRKASLPLEAAAA